MLVPSLVVGSQLVMSGTELGSSEISAYQTAW